MGEIADELVLIGLLYQDNEADEKMVESHEPPLNPSEYKEVGTPPAGLNRS